jgi:hypothetical protein
MFQSAELAGYYNNLEPHSDTKKRLQKMRVY